MRTGFYCSHTVTPRNSSRNGLITGNDDQIALPQFEFREEI